MPEAWFRPRGSVLRAPLCAVLLAALAAPAAFSAAAPVPAPVRTPEEISAAREYFLLARESDRTGDAAAALAWYRLAFRHDAGSRDLCFLYLERLRDAGEVDSAVALGRACAALAGDSARMTFAEHKLLGEVALRADNSTAALRHYRAAYARDEDDGDVLYVLSGLLEERGDWEAYATVLERLLPRLDYPPRLMERLARAYGRLNRPEAAIPVLRAAWDATGQVAYGRALASYYDSKGLNLSLLAVAERLAALDPEPEHAWLLARAYAAADRPEQAAAVSAALLEDQPGNPGVRYLHASLLFERGRYKEALREAESLAKEFPEEAAHHYLAGSAALELRKRGARAFLEKALALSPLSPDYRARAAYADYALGDASRAESRAEARLAYGAADSLGAERALLLEGLAHARLARELEPRGAWERRAVFSDSAAARRQKRAALARFEAILARNSGHRAALFEAGALRERLGDGAGSKVLLRELIARDTLHALAMNYLAYTITEQDTAPPAEMAEAGRLLDRALELDPENGAFLDSKGWWFYRGGARDSAVAWLTRAADAVPDDPAVLDHLARAQHALDRREEACATLERVRRLDPGHALSLDCPAGTKGAP